MRTLKTIANISLVTLLALAGCSTSGTPPKNVDVTPKLKDLFIPDHTRETDYFPVDSTGVPLTSYKARDFDIPPNGYKYQYFGRTAGK